MQSSPIRKCHRVSPHVFQFSKFDPGVNPILTVLRGGREPTSSSRGDVIVHMVLLVRCGCHPSANQILGGLT